jgi:hypothetical protein
MLSIVGGWWGIVKEKLPLGRKRIILQEIDNMALLRP